MANSKKPKTTRPRKESKIKRGIKGAIKLAVEPPAKAITPPEKSSKKKHDKEK